MNNRVGFGTYPLVTLSKDRAKEMVRLFIKNGGYFLDTAPLYGFGEIEKMLGDVLKEFPRDQFFIASKCGYKDVEGKTFHTIRKSSKYEDIIRECELSLARLKLDYLDLYFVHVPDLETPFEETVSALVKLKRDGKIKEIGVSNVNLQQLKEYNKTGDIKYVQNRFSLLSPIEKDFEKYLLDNKIGLVAYHVIERGLITKKVYADGKSLQNGVLRVAKADWNFNDAAKLVKNRYAKVAKNLGITIEELAIAWVLSKPFVSFALVGTTNPDHLKLNLACYLKNIQLE